MPKSRCLIALLMALAIGIAITLPYAAYRYRGEASVYFEVDAAVNTGVRSPAAQVFVDTGLGFNGRESSASHVRPGGAFYLLRLPVPGWPIQKLRFDPINGSGTIQLKQPRLVNPYGVLWHTFDLEAAEPVLHIDRKTVLDGTLLLRTPPDGTDPGILWVIPASVDPLIRDTAWRRTARSAFKTFGVVSAITFAALFLAGYTGFPKKRGSNPKGAYPGLPEGFFRSHRSTFGLAVTVFAIMLLVRSWDNLSHPGLYVEDASLHFNLYYGGQRPLSFILQHPLGYYNILNNGVAWCASKMDVRLPPVVYQTIAVALSAACASLLLFSGLFRTRWVMVGVPAVLGLTGLNHIFYYTTLAFQVYTTVILLLCILFLPAPRSTLGRFILWCICLLLIWSGPYSVVAVPTALLFLLFFDAPRKNRQMVWIVVLTLIYALSAEGMVRLENLLDPVVMKRMTDVLVEKVFFLDLLGPSTPLKLTVFSVVTGAVVYRLRRVPDYLPWSIILLIIVLASLAPLFLSVKVSYYHYPKYGHLVIPQFFWLVFVLFTGDTLLRSVPRKAAIHGVAAAAMLMLVLFDNHRHPEKGRFDVMVDVPAFLEAVHEAEQLDLVSENRYAVLTMPGATPGPFNPWVELGSLIPTARPLAFEEVQNPGIRRFLATPEGANATQ